MRTLNNPMTLILAALATLLASANATARTCEVSITGDDKLQFNKSEITVSAECDSVKLTLEHIGKLPVEQMGHNWTLTKTADWKDIAQMGQAAGLENNYLPVNDPRVLASTDMIGGGESVSITFDLANLSADSDYTYFCSFPGHWAVMNGKFIIEADSSAS